MRNFTHLDLFSGIGGFAYAVDQVWPDAQHVFCEIDPFCQAVLTKHWPNSKIYGDIRTITTDTKHNGITSTKTIGTDSSTQTESQAGEKLPKSESSGVGALRATETGWDLLTGGFPCQPFSQAGRRRGTTDNRFLWPEMLRVIQLTKPTWVIAENVRGLLTIEQGVVFEQVCLDLETSCYEVQPLIIPAVSVNAPHRRDRVWIIAYHTSEGLERGKQPQTAWPQSGERSASSSDAQNTIGQRSRRRMESNGQILGGKRTKTQDAGPSWEENWIKVAQRFCQLDDGVSDKLVTLPNGEKISYSKWRKESLKAMGNAIVPAVAIEIMKGIKSTQLFTSQR